MQNTILTISLTLITALGLVYYLKTRKSRSALKNGQPDRQNDKGETNTKAAAATEI